MNIAGLETALDKVAENFKENIKFELETSDVNEETKYLVEQIARQTYYSLTTLKDILPKYLK